jgi:hypothetical protein
MACEHKRLQCVNNAFFCLDCGARVEREARADKQPAPEEKTQEGPKKAKRTAVKKGEK